MLPDAMQLNGNAKTGLGDLQRADYRWLKRFSRRLDRQRTRIERKVQIDRASIRGPNEIQCVPPFEDERSPKSRGCSQPRQKSGLNESLARLGQRPLVRSSPIAKRQK
jgi:hypothetical protein